MQQKNGESFNSFANRLRVQAEVCCFDDINFEMKEKLLTSYPSLKNSSTASTTLDQIISMGIAEEVAKINFKYQPVAQTEGKSIKNYSRSSAQASSDVGCTRCGQKNHVYYSPNCPAQNHPCTFCGKNGHFARMCRSQKRLLYGNMMQQSKIPRIEKTHPNNVQLTVNNNHINQHVMIAASAETPERNSRVTEVSLVNPPPTQEKLTKPMDESEIQIQNQIMMKNFREKYQTSDEKLQIEPIETFDIKESVNNLILFAT